MDEILRATGFCDLDELLHNVMYWIDNELSDIEDMFFNVKYDSGDIIDKIADLRSQLI